MRATGRMGAVGRLVGRGRRLETGGREGGKGRRTPLGGSRGRFLRRAATFSTEQQTTLRKWANEDGRWGN